MYDSAPEGFARRELLDERGEEAEHRNSAVDHLGNRSVHGEQQHGVRAQGFVLHSSRRDRRRSRSEPLASASVLRLDLGPVVRAQALGASLVRGARAGSRGRSRGRSRDGASAVSGASRRAFLLLERRPIATTRRPCRDEEGERAGATSRAALGAPTRVPHIPSIASGVENVGRGRFPNTTGRRRSGDRAAVVGLIDIVAQVAHALYQPTSFAESAQSRSRSEKRRFAVVFRRTGSARVEGQRPRGETSGANHNATRGSTRTVFLRARVQPRRTRTLNEEAPEWRDAPADCSGLCPSEAIVRDDHHRPRGARHRLRQRLEKSEATPCASFAPASSRSRYAGASRPRPRSPPLALARGPRVPTSRRHAFFFARAIPRHRAHQGRPPRGRGLVSDRNAAP